MKLKTLIPRLLRFLFIGVVLYFMAIFYDAFANAKYNGRNHACRANFKNIARRVSLYRNRQGQMPKYLTEATEIGNHSFLTCPQVGFERGKDGYMKHFTYAYRFVKSPGSNDIICWDRKPHIPGYRIFTYKNYPRRNVLYADGRIKTLSEEEFQAKKLVGKIEQFDPYSKEWVFPKHHDDKSTIQGSEVKELPAR